jgi:hypothetical protein
LENFVVAVQHVLKSNFVGAYLVGSLATGDFDLDSDVDFLVITGNELTETEVRSLQTMHRQIHSLACYPAEHLEGSYLSKHFLNRPDAVGVQPLWYIDNGSTFLDRSVHDNQWHVRWILRESAIVIRGADPKTLMPPVPGEPLRAEMVTAIHELAANFDAEIAKPIGYFNTRFGQSFAVLTCSRMLHTLHSGTVQSKRSGVDWAQQSLDPEWHDLIRHAWTERQGARFGAKIRQPAQANLLQSSSDFMAYARLECLNRNPESGAR